MIAFADRHGFASQPPHRPEKASHRLVTNVVRGHLGLLGAAMVLRIAWEMSPMLVPAVVGWLVDGLATGSFEGRHVLTAAAMIGGLGAIQGLSAWGYTEVSARLSLRVVTRIRIMVFERVLSPGAPALSQGDLLSRALRDTDQIRGFVDRVFIRSLTSVVRAVFPLTMLFVTSWRLALWALAVLPLMQLVSQVIQRRMQHASRAVADTHASLTEALQRQLAERGASSDAVRDGVALLEEQAQVLEAQELSSSRLLAGLRAVVWASTALGLALVWMLGGQMVLTGELTLGTLISFAGYTAFIFRPLRQMTSVLKTYRTKRASLDRIAELLP